MSRKGLALIAMVLLVLALSPLGSAQAISGDLVGRVTDSSGAVVSGAKITATNEATGVKFDTKSTSVGDYRFSNLPVGTYDLSAATQNMSSGILKGASVELNKTATANLTMKVGNVSTTVEVSAAAPLIDTTTAQVQTSYNNQQAQILPSAGLGGALGGGVLNLSLLQAGVASAGAMSVPGAGEGPSVGGARPRNNNYEVEGVDNNSKSVTGALLTIPNDAVSDFTVLQNQYSPEFGHSSGGQFNIIVQSGTNAFHGMAYEYLQNRDLNAIDAAVARPAFGTGTVPTNPRFDDNRFGGQIGGPVIKNKLFFFFNYEFSPLGQATQAAGAVSNFTAAGFSQLATIPGVSATNLGILQKFVPPAPLANGTPVVVNGVSVPTGVINLQAPNFTNNKALVASMDYDISDKDQLRGRYIYNSQIGIDINAQLGAFYLPQPNIGHLFTASEYHTFSSHITNEFRLGYNHFAQTFSAGNFSFPGLDSFPNLTFADLGLQIGPDPNAPQFTVQGTTSAVDNLTWVKGNHTFQFGAEGRKYISPQSFTQRSRGDYDYNSVASYLLDLSPDNLGERSIGQSTYYGDQIAFYWYVNDSWKIRPNFTLNLGLRHEYTTIPFGERQQNLNEIASVPGLISFDNPKAPKTNFAPRLGFAWSPGNSTNTSIRGGWGMTYDVLFDNIGILGLPPELSVTEDVPSLVNQTPNFLASGGLPPGAGGITTFPDALTARAATSNHVVVNQKDPVSIQWNLGIQHIFAGKYTVEARYLGSHAYHQDEQLRINTASPLTAAFSLPTFLSMPSQATLNSLPLTLDDIENIPNEGFVPAFAAAGFNNSLITQDSPTGMSIYHGLALQANRHFTNGLQFQAAYTYSHLIDNSTADFFTTTMTPRRPQNAQDVNADRSNSALDHRHRLSFSAIYDVPWFKHSNAFLKNTLGNWELVPVYTYETGEFVDVQSGQDSNLNFDSAGDRTVINPNGVPGTGSDVTPLTNSGGAVVGYLANNPSAQYIIAGPGAFATSGRNTLSTPPIDNVDMTLSKTINITERFKFMLAGQAFNLFNHPQFIPGGSLNQVFTLFSTTGDAQRAFVLANDPNFNKASQIFPSNSRTMQVVGKFIF